MGGRWLAVAVLLALGSGAQARAEPVAPRYEIEAEVGPASGEIRGRVRIRFTRSDRRALLHLYPNRFRADGDEVDDTNRSYVYPRGVFAPGGISIESVALPAGRELVHRAREAPGHGPGTLLEVDLPEGSPGAAVELDVFFRTEVPERYGPFGVTEQGLVAVGGWHPYLAARDAAGQWHIDWAPPAADFEVRLEAPPGRAIVLGDEVLASGRSGRVRAEGRNVRNFALLLPVDRDLVEERVGDTAVQFVEPHQARSHRVGPGPEPDQSFRATVRAALERRPPSLAAPARLTVAQIPLRWNLTTQSDAPVVASDRALHVQEVLAGFHAAQVAQTVYAALLRPRILRCEAPGDRNWVQQGVAWYLADRFLRETDENHQSVHQWIRWLDFFAIVDRFESSPKIPFAGSFFENSLTDDELRESVFSWARREPPSRLSFARLDRRLGEPPVQAALGDYVARLDGPCVTFAAALATATSLTPAELAHEVEEARAPVAPDGPRARIDPALRPRGRRSTYQFVLDSADVDVSSSQFGIGGLFVLRKRHDYTRDLAFAPYVNERSYGMRVGPRLHFGPRNDPNLYRHNLFAFYQLSGLITGFRDDARPAVRNGGAVGGFGLRYDYSDVYWFNDPTDKRELSLFADGYDPTFGGDYSYARWGVRIRGTTPLGTPNTLLALELLAGFEESFSDRGIPIQEQYALGGQLSIRGVSINEKLARNIGLARVELRQAVYPEFDLNLLDFLTYRRPQVRLFLDAGNVDDSAGRAVDPEHWAIGGGVGVNVFYDFMGFFPSTAYLEVATRFDRDPQDVQVLFGTRQAF